MAKFKPPKGKRDRKGVPQGALPCVVFIIGGILLLMLFLFLVLKNSGQS
ncbi:MAG: hypothetical protein ACLQKA_01375 [Bryobacteraceae bacterium]|jgi:hypothetical protein